MYFSFIVRTIIATHVHITIKGNILKQLMASNTANNVAIHLVRQHNISGKSIKCQQGNCLKACATII